MTRLTKDSRRECHKLASDRLFITSLIRFRNGGFFVCCFFFCYSLIVGIQQYCDTKYDLDRSCPNVSSQGPRTFFKPRATSQELIKAKCYQFDTQFGNRQFAQKLLV